jgi:hypothetical protein
MSPVLFLFIMQTFMDTIKDEAPPSEFHYFPERKMATKNAKWMPD